MSKAFTTATRRHADQHAGEQMHPLDFWVDDDQFFATPVAPAGALLDAASIDVASDNGEKSRLMGAFFDAVLLPESLDRFVERLRSPTEPIDLPTLISIVRYLAAEYSGRPTVPSAPSGGGRSTTGPSSTVGAQPEISSPSTFPQTG